MSISARPGLDQGGCRGQRRILATDRQTTRGCPPRCCYWAVVVAFAAAAVVVVAVAAVVAAAARVSLFLPWVSCIFRNSLQESFF